MAIYVALALSLSTGYTLSVPSDTFAEEASEEVQLDSSNSESNLNKTDADGSSALGQTDPSSDNASGNKGDSSTSGNDAALSGEQGSGTEAGSTSTDTSAPSANNGSEGIEVEGGSADTNDPAGAAGSYDESASSLTLDNTLVYEAEDYTVEVEIAGKAAVGEAVDVAAQSADDGVVARETVEDDQVAGLAMTVAVMDEDDPAYRAVEEYAQENAAEESAVDVSALEFGFTYNGKELDVAGCDISAQVTPSEKLQAEADAIEITEDTAEEAEVGIVLTALECVEGEEVQPADTVTVEKNAAEPAMMTLALDSAAPALQLVTRDAINPTYTVQYYGYLEMLVRDDKGYLQILDTSKNGDGSGGNLPSNTGNLDQSGLYVEDDGSLESELVLKQLYEDESYEYFKAPSLPYVNIFRENGNYTATEVWVLKEGGDSDSTTEDDWEVHKNIGQATELHFTNNPDKATQENTIYIEDDTVIRLVANQTASEYNNAAQFYDYDITDGNGNTRINNEAQGINSTSNYSGNGAKLAFGNANTGTGMHLIEWFDGSRNNTLNKTNSGPIGGCTFGLVKGLDGQGNIIYADGVDAPKLFDDGTAQGKREISGMSLDFNRAGDTYTLSGVKGTSLDNLEHFTELTGYSDGTPFKDSEGNPKSIYTNNFWPLDGTPGADGLTGERGNTGKYTSDGVSGDYPSSDDSKPHNNMFGMQYTVNFELTDNYVGPLEYYFFGDDDMWVFLDGKLICDIGGVHSSVGMYVNLWDYIKKGDSGKHTLKFYYTERGLSGSTCYMQFTLPSVSSGTPTYQNSQLKIEKRVVGSADPDAEFSFEIAIGHPIEKVENSDYAIVRYKNDGTIVERSLLTDGKGSFKLKADEYVLIDYLQHGTTYIITETNAEGFAVSSTIDGTLETQGTKVTGTVPQDKSSIVLFTNTAKPKLPNTGGPGTEALMISGVAALTAAAAVGARMRRKGTR